MCLITVEVTDQTQAVKLLQQLKLEYQSRLKLKTFMVFQNVEGGSLSQLIVMIGAHSMEEYGKTERLMEDINAIEAQLKTKIVNSITSEKLLYREDMSLFAKEP